jgi:hypothetical protein
MLFGLQCFEEWSAKRTTQMTVQPYWEMLESVFEERGGKWLKEVVEGSG